MNHLFIEPEREIDISGRQSASYVRKEFDIESGLVSAKLKLSACGLYKAYLNGKELDSQCFLPGFTAYTKRLQYQEYEISNLLKEGKNAIGAVIGDGWYRGRIGLYDTTAYYGNKTKFLCVLKLEYEDGHIEEVVTDASWKAMQNGPVRENDLKGGENYDARLEMPGWCEAGYDDSEWHEAVPASYEGTLVPSLGEKILEQERFTPKIVSTPDGAIVLDFGQNMSGYVKFHVKGKAGWKVRLTHGETLDENGNFTLKNLQLEGNLENKQELGEAFGQVLNYTLKDGEQEYKPVFTICGFQYVKLENWPEEVKPENFEAIAVYSDIHVTGKFECSNPLVNRLVENVKWSERSNFVDIPTDCPTRERTGWTGDIGIFAESACYLSDPKKFLEKWMKDFALLQHPDGNLPFDVPDMAIGHRGDGSAGWSDAIYLVPRTLYQYYGDKKILEDYYETIKHWVEFNRERAKAKHPDHVDRTEPWWDYILDTGFHFGEWLEPGSVMTEEAAIAATHPDYEVATAFFADATRSLSEMARILNKKEDVDKYKNLYGEIRDAYEKCFLEDGTVKSDRQCRYVRPLQMNLLDEKTAKRVAAELNEKVIANDYKIGTGFLTTPMILPMLTKYGYVETAYKMLENTRQPGWLYAVTKGATTVWENWYGKDADNVPRDSMNHYSPGSVICWLYQTTAGITALEPGFETIGICPVPGGTLTYAKAEIDTCKGKIKVDWKIDEGIFKLAVMVPGKAIVTLPDGSIYEIEAGKRTFSCAYEK